MAHMLQGMQHEQFSDKLLTKASSSPKNHFMIDEATNLTFKQHLIVYSFIYQIMGNDLMF
jgi:hypothetical protein